MNDSLPMAPAARRRLEGRQLGRYRLRHQLAEGGMGGIYLAQIRGEQGFERWVAVKVANPDHAKDPDFATMLGDEARLIARLHHPNVCSVIDFGREGDLLYMVMEYLHGESLSAASKRAWAEHQSFPAWLAARALVDAARGLHAAHELTDALGEPLDLVHRDVSAGNIVISYDGPAKVIDFGVVRARGRNTKTADGTIKGKLSHMAPEQLLGEAVDRRADVWSLGVVLWETTLGRSLFRSASQGETVQRVVHGPITRPSEITPNYPPELEQIVMAALTRDVERRTKTAAAFAAQLEAWLYGLGRPSSYAEVAWWMRETFSDRRLVREGLLDAPEDSGPHDTRGLRDDQTQTNLVHGPVSKRSFAPPPTSDMPTAAVSLRARASEPTVAEQRPTRRGGSRGTVVALGVLLLLVSAALVYVLFRGTT